jgi:glutamine synthetase type III
MLDNIFASILDRNARRHMKRWHIERFKRDFPHLFKTIIASMRELHDNPIPKNYEGNVEILRPCLWFCKGQVITYEKMSEYYTKKAIDSLLEYGYIKIVK